MKAKCEKCKNCILISKENFVFCNYLKSIEPHRFMEKPKYCPKFENKEKQNGNTNK